MSGPRLVEVDDGLEICTTSTVDARFLYREIFTFNGYGDLPLPPRAFVVDVGANIGLFLMRVKAARPDAEVLAFEPVPDLVVAARENVRRHRLSMVHLHEMALGAEAERGVTFTYYPTMPSSSTRYPEQQVHPGGVLGRDLPERVLERLYRGRELVLDVARLSDFLPDGRPVDLLKVDTSGSELDVLRGVAERHWPLIRSLVLDVQDRHGRIAAVRDVLQARGMRVQVRPAPMAAGDGLNYLVHADAPEA